MRLSNKVIFPILLFIAIYTSCALVYLLLDFIENSAQKAVVFSVVLTIICFVLIKKYKLSISCLTFNEIRGINTRFILYTTLVTILFIGINIIQNTLYTSEDIQADYKQNVFFYVIVYFPIRAIGEEFFYRGLLLNYFENRTSRLLNNFRVSNIIISILMVIPHFGFFFIMPLYNALLAIMLVFIASLYFGYVYKVTHQSIVWCIVLHILFNLIHFFINCYF